jgi:hypothetical protein
MTFTWPMKKERQLARRTALDLALSEICALCFQRNLHRPSAAGRKGHGHRASSIGNLVTDLSKLVDSSWAVLALVDDVPTDNTNDQPRGCLIELGSGLGKAP